MWEVLAARRLHTPRDHNEHVVAVVGVTSDEDLQGPSIHNARLPKVHNKQESF